MIHISLREQKLFLLDTKENLKAVYPISSAKNGAGELKNSFKTPRGKHIIRAKIGDNAPLFTIFKARRPVGVYNPHSDTQEDLILTRILWLSGLEGGKNRLKNVDTMQRFIYI